MEWTEDRVAVMRRLWREGLPASLVAQALGGVSRSAVLGKLMREGLLKSRRAASAPRRPGEARPAAEASPTPAVRLTRGPRGRLPTTPWDDRAFSPLPGSQPRPWFDRLEEECAFPVGGDSEAALSCCEPRRRRSAYCLAHHALVYAPPAPPVAELVDRRAA